MVPHFYSYKCYFSNQFYCDPLTCIPIHDAVKKGNIAMVVASLKNDPEHLNYPDENGNAPLHIAATYGYIEIVKLLIEYGAHIEQGGEEGRTVFHCAAMEGEDEILKFLFLHEGFSKEKDQKPMFDVKDQDGWTPLHYAAYNGRTETVKLLVTFGANIDEISSAQYTSLHYAVCKGHAEIVHALLQNGATMNSQDTEGTYIIQGEILKMLLQHGAKV